MKRVQKWIYQAVFAVVFLAASTAASAAPAWEYVVEQVHAPMNSQTLQVMENKLAAKGQAGWELVAIVLHGRMYTLTYKRPK